jgi:hypothetical protein
MRIQNCPGESDSMNIFIMSRLIQKFLSCHSEKRRDLSIAKMNFVGLLAFGDDFATSVYEMYPRKKDNQLLHRSRPYFKRISLSVMKGALDGFPCSFEEGYGMFKERFN